MRLWNANLHFSFFFPPPFLYHKQVYYTPQDSSIQPKDVQGSNYQLGNLRYGTMFNIGVAAVNGAGEGNMSNATGSTTIGG